MSQGNVTGRPHLDATAKTVEDGPYDPGPRTARGSWGREDVDGRSSLGLGRHGRSRGLRRDLGAQRLLTLTALSEFKNGKAIRVWTYLNPKEALEAAGLEE